MSRTYESRGRTVGAFATALCLVALATSPLAASAQDQPLTPPAATPNPVALEAPAGDGTGVRLTTDLGDIVIGLFNESAPVAAENFANLAAAGFYDGVGFHRIVPGYVLQGGDPQGSGAGGPGYTIPDEEVVGRYGRGVVAMARTPQPDSQGSQFFVVLDDAAEAQLDAARTYVIFGRVVEGMDVVDAIVARGPASDLVEDPVRIRSAAIEQVELPPEPTAAPPTEGELAAEALLATVPAEVAGIALEGRGSFSSDVIRQQAPPAILAELETLAQAHGADLGGLSIAQARGENGEAFANVLAVSIGGVPAAEALEPLARLVLGADESLAVTDQTIAGRAAKRLEPTPGFVAYAVPRGEVVWFLVVDEGSLEEVVAALP
jgi:cyclophilin family peptidyl-prolyl cis-trans isomerase